MVTIEPRIANEERVNLAQCSQILDVTRATIYTWMKEGKIKPSSKMHGHWMFTGREIRRVWRGDELDTCTRSPKRNEGITIKQ